MSDYQIIAGDCLETMRGLPANSVQCVVTSPPYYGLRDYGTATWEGGDPECDHRKVQDAAKAIVTSTLGGGKKTTGHLQEGYGATCNRCGARRVDSQIGLEETPEAYVAKLVEVFREVRRVLRDDGTLWLNLGDSYAGSWGNYGGQNRGNGTQRTITKGSMVNQRAYEGLERWMPPTAHVPNLKPKDLIGIPWMVAFALRADGWYLRSDIIWAKPNPMPESVTDRPTKAHEYIFLLSKSREYYYDAEAIKEPATYGENRATFRGGGTYTNNNSFKNSTHAKGDGEVRERPETISRNRRSVWTVTTKPYSGAHFATFPPDLIEPCILAGSRPCDTVLDPFNGSGTTGAVALKHGRKYIGLELNPDYIALAHKRIQQSQPMLFLEGV